MSVAPTTKYITVVAATGATNIVMTDLFSRYVIETAAPVTLSANLSFNISGTPFDGQTICFDLPGTITLSTYTFQVFGVTITAEQALKRCKLYFRWDASGVGAWYVSLTPDFSQSDVVSSDNLISVDLAKIDSGTGAGRIIRTLAGGALQAYDAAGSDRMLIGDGTDVVSLAADAAGGDVTPSIVSGAIRWLIGAGKIVNAHISAAAAIARTKLASGTADHVVINDNSGVMSSEAQLNVLRGGTGLDNSAATGLQKYAAGTPSVGLLVASDVTADALTPSVLTAEARTEVLNFMVSFETGEQCDNKILMPYAGTVTSIYGIVVKALSATDAGTVTPKNQGGTTMTSGVLTFPLSSALNTAITSTPSANNTFIAGDVLSFTSAKTTVAGKILLSITIERSN